MKSGTGSAYGQNDRRGRSPLAGSLERFLAELMPPPVVARLNLTAPQEARVQALLDVEGGRLVLLSGQLTKNARQLQMAARSGPADHERLQPLVSQRRQLEAELIAAKEQLAATIYDVLTAEQRAVLPADWGGR